MSGTTTKSIPDTLAEMGLSIHSRLTRDDFDGIKGQSHWLVTVSKDGKSFDVEYHLGEAYRQYRNGRKIELNHSGRHTVYEVSRNKATLPTLPDIVDVMACLTLDAQIADNASSFEEFCEEFGYDTDSIKALKAYEGCRDAFFNLRKLGLDLDELSSLFQDY